MKTMLLASLALAFSLPGVAQERCIKFDSVLQGYAAGPLPVSVLGEEHIPEFLILLSAISGETYSEGTRAFMVTSKKELLLGVEVNGCLLDPISITGPKKRMSGRVGDRTFA